MMMIARNPLSYNCENNWNDAALIRDGSTALEILLAGQNSKFAQHLYDLQKNAVTICRSQPDYCFESSSDIESDIQELYGRLLEFTRENTQFFQRVIEDVVTEALGVFNRSFRPWNPSLLRSYKMCSAEPNG